MLQFVRISLAVGLVAALAAGASAESIKGNYVEARTCDVYLSLIHI